MKKACIWTVAALLAVFLASASAAWDYRTFPDLEGKTPDHKVFAKDLNVLFELFDVDKDGKLDAGLGRVPKSVTPILTMTPLGPREMYVADAEGVAVTHYWLDLNGDGCPCRKDGGEGLDWAEFLHDPEADGLNGNEKATNKADDTTV